MTSRFLSHFPKKLLRFKDEMKERNLLDSNAWLTVLDVCSVSGDIDSMLKIFEEMKEGGFLDELAYNRVIKGYSRMMRTRTVLESFINENMLSSPVY